MTTTLQKRLTTSAFFIAITLYAIFFSPEWIFFLVIEIFVLLGFYEYLNLCEKKAAGIPRAAGLMVASLLPLSVYHASESLVLAGGTLALFMIHFHPRARNQALVGTALTVFGLIYVVWFFSHLIKIRSLDHGPFWVLYVILLAKGGDAGAYFVGKKYGRIKLIEHISPNKSVEGALGGFVTTVALSLLSKLYLPHAAVQHLLLLGIGVGFLAQLGDLAESVIKRDVGVKDSGAVPGLGGILDVLDSLLLTVPFVYYYIAQL